MSRFDTADGLTVAGAVLIAAGFYVALPPATLFWLGAVLMVAGLLKAKRSG